MYLCHILGLDLNRMFQIKADNTAVTEILFNRERANLTLLNDTCHLNGGRIAVPKQEVVSHEERGPVQPAF